MKTIDKELALLLCASLLIFFMTDSCAQDPAIKFGKSVSSGKIFSKTKEKDQIFTWINVNTDPDTWHTEKDILICSGNPIGVMRSEKQYKNFILHVEWSHMEAGGNSGVFV